MRSCERSGRRTRKNEREETQMKQMKDRVGLVGNVCCWSCFPSIVPSSALAALFFSCPLLSTSSLAPPPHPFTSEESPAPAAERITGAPFPASRPPPSPLHHLPPRFFSKARARLRDCRSCTRDVASLVSKGSLVMSCPSIMYRRDSSQTRS